jgi:hypothetical protein
MTSAYGQLTSKVDAFASKVHAERAGDMRCAPGCAACCHAELTVCAVEADRVRDGLAALSADARARIVARADAPEIDGGACVMLEEARCAIYAHRPLVCRTQGLPLAYPPGFVPANAVRAKDARGHDVVWCPLNFEGDPPRPDDVLDAGRVDEMLGLVNRLAGTDATRSDGRVSLRALARIAAGSGR